MQILWHWSSGTLTSFGPRVTYARKVFILLTLCGEVCHYCTFATTPRGFGHARIQAVRVDSSLEIMGRSASVQDALAASVYQRRETPPLTARPPLSE